MDYASLLTVVCVNTSEPLIIIFSMLLIFLKCEFEKEAHKQEVHFAVTL
jgi:hypothetical protein